MPSRRPILLMLLISKFLPSKTMRSVVTIDRVSVSEYIAKGIGASASWPRFSKISRARERISCAFRVPISAHASGFVVTPS